MASFILVSQDSHFPLANIPFGTGFSTHNPNPRCVSRIGDFVVDLAALEAEGLFQELSNTHFFSNPTLNSFMSEDKALWRAYRSKIQSLFAAENPLIRDNEQLKAKILIPISEFTNTLPVNIGDYTDFYSSRNHAFNVGCMFRGPQNALQDNWLRLPVGYHGRSSSVVVSGHPVKRPRGQIKPLDSPDPIFSSCKKLDHEVEIGVFLGGKLNQLGEPINIAVASEHVFGLVLLNDWSARDIQSWEYVPLGPFTAKNFQTSISPWIITTLALEPFTAGLPAQDPVPLPYLREDPPTSFNITIDTFLKTPSLSEPHKISTTNMQHLYWSIYQMLAHHSVTGCNMRPGDLLGTGTISGPTPDSLGCLLEMSTNGKTPVALPNGETRSFLNDGDELIIVGKAEGENFTIGFGDVRGVILPALEDQYFHN
mmetsp:Transcript_29086/g.28788  ORF Transcript_29086/g.28788 Transcript_29086/m.28788 type:complete len:425 (-) Transcript_29086:27-1301(-)